MGAYKIWEFRKNCANEWPLKGKFMTKIRNFDSFRGCIPTFLPQYTWNLVRGSTPVPNFTFIGATCRPCAACGAKPLSKNNTGMAVLRTGLPVKRHKKGKSNSKLNTSPTLRLVGNSNEMSATVELFDNHLNEYTNKICSVMHSKHTSPGTATFWSFPEANWITCRRVMAKKTTSAFLLPSPLAFQTPNCCGV